MNIPLYQKIAETIRQDILQGNIAPGKQLPPIRTLANRWECTQGVVQRAYQELVREGYVISRPGFGTQVISHPPIGQAAPLRKAALIHKAETFLLEALNSGYEPDEIRKAVQLSLERWQVIQSAPAHIHEQRLIFSGSHDLAVSSIAMIFDEIAPGWKLDLLFSGSMGGLLALVAGKAHIAGCHLWDESSDTYNEPYIRQIFPNQRIAMVNLALRNLGLILPSGNPLKVQTLQDLSNRNIRFINRQPGSGTRIWLDTQLKNKQIDPNRIPGYENSVATHSAVAQSIAEGNANAGIGLQASAHHYGLDFIQLTQERYDLIFIENMIDKDPIRGLLSWLKKTAAKELIGSISGYDVSQTGDMSYVNNL